MPSISPLPRQCCRVFCRRRARNNVAHPEAPHGLLFHIPPAQPRKGLFTRKLKDERGQPALRKLTGYQRTAYAAQGSVYNKSPASAAAAFINCLRHTKGEWYGAPFDLIDWQEKVIRDVFDTL